MNTFVTIQDMKTTTTIATAIPSDSSITTTLSTENMTTSTTTNTSLNEGIINILPDSWHIKYVII